MTLEEQLTVDSDGFKSFGGTVPSWVFCGSEFDDWNSAVRKMDGRLTLDVTSGQRLQVFSVGNAGVLREKVSRMSRRYLNV